MRRKGNKLHRRQKINKKKRKIKPIQMKRTNNRTKKRKKKLKNQKRINNQIILKIKLM